MLAYLDYPQYRLIAQFVLSDKTWKQRVFTVYDLRLPPKYYPAVYQHYNRVTPLENGRFYCSSDGTTLGKKKAIWALTTDDGQEVALDGNGHVYKQSNRLQQNITRVACSWYARVYITDAMELLVDIFNVHYTGTHVIPIPGSYPVDIQAEHHNIYILLADGRLYHLNYPVGINEPRLTLTLKADNIASFHVGTSLYSGPAMITRDGRVIPGPHEQHSLPGYPVQIHTSAVGVVCRMRNDTIVFWNDRQCWECHLPGVREVYGIWEHCCVVVAILEDCSEVKLRVCTDGKLRPC